MKNKTVIMSHLCVLVFGISIMAMSCTPPLSPVPEPVLKYEHVTKTIAALKNEAIERSPVWENPTSDAVYDYAITPDLPRGLTIDAKTGTISGIGKIPSGKVLSETVHTITATNTVRSITSSVTIYIYPYTKI